MLREEQPLGSFLIRSCSLCLLSNRRNRFAKFIHYQIRFQKPERVVAETEKEHRLTSRRRSLLQLLLKKNGSTVYWTKVQYTRYPFFTRVQYRQQRRTDVR
jgi:hypothetical protein